MSLLGKFFEESPAGGVGGLLSGIGNALSENSNLLLGYGAGGAEGMMRGALLDDQSRERRRKQAEVEKRRTAYQEWAKGARLDPSTAALFGSDPELAQTIVADRLKYREPKERSFEERLFRALPNEMQQQYVQQKFLGGTSTDDIKEFKFAQGNGFTGGFTDFLKTKRGGSTNAPSGYAYGPDGRLAPIPGGPADPERDINEPLPAETASRFGLANQFFKRFDGIEKDLTSKDPKSVGPLDGLGFGQSGALQRDMKMGSEAMVRMLTGAGRTESEAREEVKQYLPDTFDSPKTVLDKQRRLRSALRDMQREALKGRRSNRQIETEYPAFPVQTYDGNAVGGAGKTSTGVPWSIKK